MWWGLLQHSDFWFGHDLLVHFQGRIQDNNKLLLSLTSSRSSLGNAVAFIRVHCKS